MKQEVVESRINIIAENTKIQGTITCSDISRIYGVIEGDLIGTAGSILILGETSMVEGSIAADTVLIDGYIKGDIEAKTKVTVSGTARIIGDIISPSVSIAFGAHFEGRCKMDQVARPRKDLATEGPSLSPA